MKLTDQQKQALIAGLILAAFLGFLSGYYYMMVVKPTLTRNDKVISELRAEVSTSKRELERINAILNNPQELRRLQEVVSRAERRLPKKNSTIEFLTVLQENLTKTGLATTRVSPSGVVKRQMYEEYPFAIKGSGRYHAIGQFLNLIECNPERFMRVNSFTIENNDRRPSQHPLSLVVSTFTFTPQ
ncbi:MAG: type 4a pilus biogenesis protein PilO [Sumerlaeia bacterium]